MSETSIQEEILQVDLEIRDLKEQHTLSNMDLEDLEILRSHRLHLQKQEDPRDV